jgi:ADP-ribosylglycohydrolase
VRAVNDTRDNDTVATIVGAAVGALHGRKALPTRWLENLTGRTRLDDEGHHQQLVAQSCYRFLTRGGMEMGSGLLKERGDS